jgi:hypothetical protein
MSARGRARAIREVEAEHGLAAFWSIVDPEAFRLALADAYDRGRDAGLVEPLVKARRRAFIERREAVRARSCPKCGAGPGEACIGSRGQARTANHRVRG